MGTSLLHLPDELITNVLFELTSWEALSLGRTCHRLYRIHNQPLLWQHYCKTEFQYWRKDDGANGSVKDSEVNPWKRRYMERAHRDRHKDEVFESLLKTQAMRNSKIQVLASDGYEGSERLHRHSVASSDLDDVLARRYWAQTAMRRIRRAQALSIWRSFIQGAKMDLIELLAAYDLFLLEDAALGIDQINEGLDIIASDIRHWQPDIDQLDTQGRAIQVLRYMQEHKKLGIESDEEYREMKNNLLSPSILLGEQAALPLQSAAIYCAVAQRLGLDAQPCNYPAHIIVSVRLEQSTEDTPDASKCLYLDPFSSPHPISFEALSSFEVLNSVPAGNRDDLINTYLQPADPAVLVRRAAENLRASVTPQRPFYSLSTRRGLASQKAALATYAFLWANVLLDTTATRAVFGAADPTRPLFATLLHFAGEMYPEDTALLEEHIDWLGSGGAARAAGRDANDDDDDFIQSYREALAAIKAADGPPAPHPRPSADSGSLAQPIKFKVGTLFRHKRYGYVAAVRGWDSRCEANEAWIEQMGVDGLQRGRSQSFYHVLVQDMSGRYVAEDNIQPITSAPHWALRELAGKYFKRWDDATGMFVSNVKDEYPDD